MLSSDVSLREGKMCAVEVAGGSLGRRRDAVWVDLIMEWSGKVTETGRCVGWTLKVGALMERKCPVVPVSATKG